MSTEMKIAWMYPDTLYLHGERGNVLAMYRFAREMGLDTKVKRVDMGKKNFDPMEYDILFYGPGEIVSFPAVIRDTWNYEHSLAEFIAAGKVLIATGATSALFGEKIVRFAPEGTEPEVIDGLCIIPSTAFEREYVYGNDELVNASYNGREFELLGNQIHMADYGFSESEGYRRLGTVVYGRGNNGQDGMEGAVHNNSIFTNMLGPLLVSNPWLTAEIIRAAAAAGGCELTCEDPDFSLELKSLELKKEFIRGKMEKEQAE